MTSTFNVPLYGDLAASIRKAIADEVTRVLLQANRPPPGGTYLQLTVSFQMGTGQSDERNAEYTTRDGDDVETIVDGLLYSWCRGTGIFPQLIIREEPEFS